jgi:hypothetical protein
MNLMDGVMASATTLNGERCFFRMGDVVYIERSDKGVTDIRFREAGYLTVKETPTEIMQWVNA